MIAVRMALRIVWASLRFRSHRVVVACVAVTLGASLPAVMVGLQAVQGRFARELETYGPNLLIVPRSGSALDRASLTVLEQAVAGGHLVSYAPFVALAAKAGERDVAVLGTPLGDARARAPWWVVEGAWPEGPSSVVLGANAAANLHLRPRDTLTLRTRHATAPLEVAGLLRTGGSEDDQVLVELDPARRLAGRPDLISFIRARARSSGDLSVVSRALEAATPDAEVRSSLQVAAAEARVLGRLQRLLLLVTAGAIAASALAVFATTAAAALERGREVAVMKALGASERWVAGLFGAEALVIGLIAGTLGFVLGLAMTQAISWQVFGVLTPPSLLALAASVTVALGVVVAASLGPIRRAARLGPAAVFRGE
ncbi:MAG: ABC transporter permease [Candidatus Rokubacteria bacterium]|nr:ABC transporter permease [Candidatus Rokubacteria bacterium]